MTSRHHSRFCSGYLAGIPLGLTTVATAIPKIIGKFHGPAKISQSCFAFFMAGKF